MTTNDNSQLLSALREAVAVVQMVFFKVLRQKLAAKRPGDDPRYQLRLAGAITNEVFGVDNPEETVAAFRRDNRGIIEQEMLALDKDMAGLCGELSDALRIQTLCDHQQGVDSSRTLQRAKDFGFLVEERDIPLPSSFMTLARRLGAEHGLISPPAPAAPAEESPTVH